MMPTKFGSLKLGVAIALFNCTYKTPKFKVYKQTLDFL